MLKTETQVSIKLGELRSSEHLHPQPKGFLIKIFLSCSRVESKIFKVTSSSTSINQNLLISNISGNQLELWLCDTTHKIIANAVINLPDKLNQTEESKVEFKMTSVSFATLNVEIKVNKREIEKIVVIQADEELLKKVQDPYLKQKKQEQELQRQKQLEEQQNLAKQVKKAAITVSKFNQKDVPFV